MSRLDHLSPVTSKPRTSETSPHLADVSVHRLLSRLRRAVPDTHVSDSDSDSDADPDPVAAEVKRQHPLSVNLEQVVRSIPPVVKDLLVKQVPTKGQEEMTSGTKSEIRPEKVEKDAPASTLQPASDPSVDQAVRSSVISDSVPPTSSSAETTATSSATLPLTEAGSSKPAVEMTGSAPVVLSSLLDPADPIPLMAASPPVPVSSALNQAAEIIPLSSDARTPSTDISSVSKSSETLPAVTVDESKTLTEATATDPDKTSDEPSLPTSSLPEETGSQAREEEEGRFESPEDK